MLGHLGINVPDLAGAKAYYNAIMPLLGFEPFLDADDEFAYRPSGGKPGTYLFFYPSAEPGPYSREPQVPFPGRLAGVKMGSGCLPTPTFPWDQ